MAVAMNFSKKELENIVTKKKYRKQKTKKDEENMRR